jgi:two-component sensor histidine kinase
MRQPECSAYLGAVAKNLPQISSLGVIALDGTLRCAADMGTASATYGDRDYFRRALSSGGFVVGLFTSARTAPSRRVLPFALPVRSTAGETLAVVAAGLSLDFLNEVVASWHLPDGGSLTIADQEGTILARNPDPERFVGTRIPAPYLALVTAPGPGTIDVISQDGTERILGYQPATIPPAGLYISTGFATDLAFASADKAQLWNLVAIAVGLVGALAISAAAGRVLIRRPINALIERARTWEANASPPQERLVGLHEAELIADALDDMGRALSEQTRQARESLRAKELLMAELNHRVKNTLAVVQSIGMQTAAHSLDGRDFSAKFAKRLQALARTHDLLTERAWDRISLRDLVDGEIAVLPETAHVSVSGATVLLPAEMAVSIGLIIHELATNGVKHGCLSAPGGKLVVAWDVEQAASPMLRFTWDEYCAAPVTWAQQAGFGTRLISRTVAKFGTSRSEMREDGLRFEMLLQLPGAPSTALAAE